MCMFTNNGIIIMITIIVIFKWLFRSKTKENKVIVVNKWVLLVTLYNE